MSGVYDTDVLVRSEDQAALLRRLDVAHLYRRALRAVHATMYGEPRPPLPAACPWSLDELLGMESDGS